MPPNDPNDDEEEEKGVGELETVATGEPKEKPCCVDDDDDDVPPNEKPLPPNGVESELLLLLLPNENPLPPNEKPVLLLLLLLLVVGKEKPEFEVWLLWSPPPPNPNPKLMTVSFVVLCGGFFAIGGGVVEIKDQ